jgi:hypothetical protein
MMMFFLFSIQLCARAKKKLNTTTKPLYQYERHFAICESCYWCATLFQKLNTSNIIIDSLEQQQVWPSCKNKSISTVSLAKVEGPDK